MPVTTSPSGVCERERRVGPDDVGDPLGEVPELRRCRGPDELDELEEGFADGAGQAAGQSTSLTTATRMPATAPAMPFLAASFWKMREMKLGEEAVVVDMGMELLKDERRAWRDCRAWCPSCLLSPTSSGNCALSAPPSALAGPRVSC